MVAGLTLALERHDEHQRQRIFARTLRPSKDQRMGQAARCNRVLAEILSAGWKEIAAPPGIGWNWRLFLSGNDAGNP